jgi:alpha-glucosidase (family GH31 glycosyl hydrolase)
VPNNTLGVPAEPWTGCTVWPALMPDAGALLGHFHARGVRTVFNLHPHYGVQYFDATYAALASALGADAASQLPLGGDYTNQSWVGPFLNITIRPLDELGVDAWWVDWQQNEWQEVLGASSQLWTSYVYYSNPFRYGETTLAPAGSAAALRAVGLRRDDRPFVLNRWGGWGHHKWPVGFSGDADTNWPILKFQVYVTATAANVAWQWSHDIGGFAGTPTPELMARWVQMGVFSPLLRPHTAGKSGSHRDIWGFPFPAFEAMRAFFRLRARLVPYLASAGRAAFDTGVVPVHPLYYAWPHAPGVYEDEALHAHFFGDDIVVAPLTAPAPGWAAAAGLAQGRSWLPPGEWIEWQSWAALAGGPAGGGGAPVFRERGYELGEMPLFSRPGTILPLRTLAGGAALGTAGAPFTALTLWVFPQAPSRLTLDAAPLTTTTALYEDDGQSTASFFFPARACARGPTHLTAPPSTPL